jgi:DNA mismatch repair protein MutS
MMDEFKQELRGHVGALRSAAKMLAAADALRSMAVAAVKGEWIRPDVVEDTSLIIDGGRHPALERLSGGCIPNDLHLGNGTHSLAILTGPNMSGKSSFMRMVASVILLAQIGSYVPASKARIGLVDRVFSRMGSGDDMIGGRSTFLVEMQETASILKGMSARSLVLCDEIGRGTSTFDGMGIAWALIEYLALTGPAQPRTIFATHFHELKAIASYIHNVINLHALVTVVDDQLVFEYKVVEGASDRSYGIEVARMAGIPVSVLNRAKEILADISAQTPPLPTVATRG